jgi:hypothetical protein
MMREACPINVAVRSANQPRIVERPATYRRSVLGGCLAEVGILGKKPACDKLCSQRFIARVDFHGC